MLMKESHAEDNADKNITGSRRQHIISRLHKAVIYAEDVVGLLSDQGASGASDTDVLEAKAYAYSLAGTEAFEKQAEGVKGSDATPDRWKACLTNYSAARVIYNALLKATKKDLFKEVLAGTVDPSIRYAAYQHRIPRTVGVPAVAQKFFPKDDAELVQAVEKIDAGALQEEQATLTGTVLEHCECYISLTSSRYYYHLARSKDKRRRCCDRSSAGRSGGCFWAVGGRSRLNSPTER
jgi:signal recognition particle subunit SRP68